MVRIKNLNTIKNYLKYLQDSFFFYLIPLYSYSVKQQIYNPDKIYICDLGIYSELGFKFSKNQGSYLENFVFLELQRRYSQIYYGKNQDFGEIDFIVPFKNKVGLLVQSCFDPWPATTEKREIKSLLGAMAKYRLKNGYVLTNDYEVENKYPEGKVYFIPAWKYFLLN